MVRGTTPNFTLRIKSDKVDLTKSQEVYVTIKQNSTEYDLSGELLSIEKNIVKCYLTQEQSLSLREGEAEMQINWLYFAEDGQTLLRGATRARTIQITKQLLRRVLE